MAKNETISDILFDSWFDVATRKYGHVTAIEQLITDNPAIWLPVTKFQGDYTALIQQNFQVQKPNLR
jgi:hypothetical protein